MPRKPWLPLRHGLSWHAPPHRRDIRPPGPLVSPRVRGRGWRHTPRHAPHPILWAIALIGRCSRPGICSRGIGRAIPLRAKIFSIVLMWAAMLYCIFGILDGRRWAQLALLAVAVGVTWHILSFATLRK